MSDLLRFTIVGIVTGAVYAIAASGLVVAYTTSGIFNFAHGALGMVLAYSYWELSVDNGWPVWLSLIVVLGLVAPLLGVLLDRVLFRRLAQASVGVALVVTVGLLVMLLGIGQSIWSGNETRTLPDLLPGRQVRILDVVITYHQLTIIIVGLVVAVVLRLLLFRTRIGVAMRAVVDNRDLAAQTGILPERVSALAWAISATLAGLAGILLAPALTLDHIGLTLLVINGYAAAILGQLRSLPLTYGGAMLLGISEAYVLGYGGRFEVGRGWLGNGTIFNELIPVLPVLFLFVVLVFLPQARLRVGRVVGSATPRVPSLIASLRAAAAFVVALTVVSEMLSDVRLFDATTGLALGMVMLSLVLLAGYGGQIALCQFAFVGIGALVMGKLFVDGQLIGIVVAGAITAAVGALVALPALRLQDLYLALVTFSVALFADKIVFDHPRTFDNGGSIFFDRVAFGPFDLSGDRAKFLVAGVGFATYGIIVLAIRRGPFGRRLAAMSDSQLATATLGLNLVGTKVAVFALSAGMAGAAGALYGVTRGSAGATDFNVVQSLFIFLLATVGGITSVTGAFIGGVVFAALPIIQEDYVKSLDLRGLFIGTGAIVVSRYANGFAGLVFDRLRQRPAAGGRDRSADERPEGAVAVESLSG